MTEEVVYSWADVTADNIRAIVAEQGTGANMTEDQKQLLAILRGCRDYMLAVWERADSVKEFGGQGFFRQDVQAVYDALIHMQPVPVYHDGGWSA